MKPSRTCSAPRTSTSATSARSLRTCSTDSVPPSCGSAKGWTKAGSGSGPLPHRNSLYDLLRHLTGAERYWFQRCLGGRDLKPLYILAPDGEIDGSDPTPLAAVVQNFLTACEQSRQVAAAHALDDEAYSVVAGCPVSARYVGWHMVEEYARHCGHADLLRESIDGAVGQ